MSEICPVCGLPKELCICEEIDKEQQRLTITMTKRKYGKPVTVISGFSGKHIDLQSLAKELKSVCACGGTLKNNVIELQGDQAERARKFLVSRGFEATIEEEGK